MPPGPVPRYVPPEIIHSVPWAQCPPKHCPANYVNSGGSFVDACVSASRVTCTRVVECMLVELGSVAERCGADTRRTCYRLGYTIQVGPCRR